MQASFLKLHFLITLLFMTTMNSQAQTIDSCDIKTGDLLFREKVTASLSQAIDQVTQTNQETHFSHVGLAVIEQDSVFVLHASSIGGTCKVSLNEFTHSESDSTQVFVYRLKQPYRKGIPQAIQKAYSMLGKPYNFSYVLSDSSHYCSEFIYKAFQHDSIFKMNPMTFKDPVTGKFVDTWVKHYEDLGISIPEGLPGCNPNGMAASEKLQKLGLLR